MKNTLVLNMLINCDCDCVISENDTTNCIDLELYIGEDIINPTIQIVNCESETIVYDDFTYSGGKLFYRMCNTDVFGTGVCSFQVIADNLTTKIVYITCTNITETGNFRLGRDQRYAFDWYVLLDVTPEEEWPIATTDSTGMVQIGDGLTITEGGLLSVNDETIASQTYWTLNATATTIGELQEEVLRLSFLAYNLCTPVFTITMQFEITVPGTVNIRISYDNLELATYSQIVSVGLHTFTVSRPLVGTVAADHLVTIRVNSEDARGTVVEQMTYASVTGSGLARSYAWDGTISFREYITPIDLTEKVVEAEPFAQEFAAVAQTPDPLNLSIGISAILINDTPISVNEFTENIESELTTVLQSTAEESVASIDMSTNIIIVGAVTETITTTEE